MPLFWCLSDFFRWGSGVAARRIGNISGMALAEFFEALEAAANAGDFSLPDGFANTRGSPSAMRQLLNVREIGFRW